MLHLFTGGLLFFIVVFAILDRVVIGSGLVRLSGLLILTFFSCIGFVRLFGRQLRIAHVSSLGLIKVIRKAESDWKYVTREFINRSVRSKGEPVIQTYIDYETNNVSMELISQGEFGFLLGQVQDVFCSSATDMSFVSQNNMNSGRESYCLSCGNRNPHHRTAVYHKIDGLTSYQQPICYSCVYSIGRQLKEDIIEDKDEAWVVSRAV